MQCIGFTEQNKHECNVLVSQNKTNMNAMYWFHRTKQTLMQCIGFTKQNKHECNVLVSQNKTNMNAMYSLHRTKLPRQPNQASEYILYIFACLISMSYKSFQFL